MSNPKARHLILDLLLASDGAPLSAREAIVACALFGISANNARVAIARLSSEGLIEPAERGSYGLSAQAHELADDVATWRTAEQRVRDWSGSYIAVHCGALGRSDRVALRNRRRAFDMLGFREMERGLWLRPDNIERDLDAVRQRLRTLGLEREASVFIAGAFDSAREARIAKLWNGKALSANYRKLRGELDTWLRAYEALDPDVAAREAFLLGGKAIRHIVYDPLLPAPLVDAEARHAFVDTVRRFDQVGRLIWQRLYETSATSLGALPSRLATPAVLAARA